MNPSFEPVTPASSGGIQDGGAVQPESGGPAGSAGRRKRPAPDPLLTDALLARLGDLLGAADTLGRYAALGAEEKIKASFLASAEDKHGSDWSCLASDAVRRQVPLLFQAVAGVLEGKSGYLMQSSAEINREGFGRGLVYSGRVILVIKSLRAGFPFPFVSLEKTLAYGTACVQEGLAFLDRYKRIAEGGGLLHMEG
ncbi:DUF269 domain-containing protein [Paenibacillus spiritus]|uniref:DUF269 domain-containing protein n=1 Tax=Paenibacillus spiritus TaxID=2496557 RepID=A0A5J5G0S5_9BACL|nr:DUF269 domain-containing protein [Paenibacillus spiritus]KAA9000347.1 DUF269 domain-containing protein [Paenibacillus spiritus]